MGDGKKLFVIDNDAGLDDAQAIMMSLAAPDVDVIALTTVTGNAPARQVAINLLRLLHVVDRLDIPIYSGCEKMLMGWERPPEYNYHGNDGFGDVPDDNPPDESLIQTKHGVQALLDLSNEHPGEITLIALGPLTNIAMAVRMDPGFGKRLKRCYIMGGNYKGEGNITSEAEFNFYSDPEAAQIVLSDLECPITLVCWELCKDHSLPWDEYDILRNKATRKCDLLRRNESKMVASWKQMDLLTYTPCDEVAMACAVDDDVITRRERKYAFVDVGLGSARGRLMVDWSDVQDRAPNVEIVTDIHDKLYKTWMHKAVS